MGYSIVGAMGQRKEAVEEVENKALARMGVVKTLCVALEVAKTDKSS